MQVSKETITPKKAMEWLKRNVHNRPLSQSHVNRLAGAMKADAWKMNGDTVRFNGNGDLIDGQHRLTACVQSGCSFDSYVVKGLEHSAFDTIDQGKARTAGDVLARHGEKHYNMLAAAVRIVCLITNTGTLRGCGATRADEITQCLEANPGLRECCELAVQYRNRVISYSLVAGLWHLFRQRDKSLADQFWTRVLSGEGLSKSMPEHLLRERMIANVTSTSKLSTANVAMLCIKAWNAVRAKKPMRCLKIQDGEEFPVIQ